jgi:SpoIID/LytB domain protein
VNGTSTSSLYGVSAVYAASALFTAVPNPTPTPTPTGSPTPTPTVTNLPDSVTFYGRGYGHGVGLSQYGAYGRAVAGQDYVTILAHYYQGATFGTFSNNEIRVLVLENFAASSTTPLIAYGRVGNWTVDGVGTVFPADARLRLIPSTSGSTTTWRLVVDAPDATVLYDNAAPLDLRVRPASGSLLQLWSKPSSYDRYRGVLHVLLSSSSATVQVANELPIEDYLRGVVPSEVPSTWPAEALKAQTLAARSYAALRIRPGVSYYDIYDDTRSQVYHGSLAEKATTDNAIAVTTGQVLTSSGAIANTLFHSTGGGATENNENVFVSSTGAKVAGAVSYLRGSSDRRPDGSAYDDASPYATWQTSTFTKAQVQAMFAADSRTNVGTLVALDLRDRGVSGRLISVTLIGADGSTKKVSGDVFISVFNTQRGGVGNPIRSTLVGLAFIP